MPPKGWVEINELYCKSCETCVTDCPTQTLAIDRSRLTARGYHPAFMINPENCTACATCAVVCPDAAITVYRGVRPTAQKDEEGS